MTSIHNLDRFLNQSRRLASVAGSSNAVGPYMVGPFQVFNRNMKCLLRRQIVLCHKKRRGGSRTVDYVRDDVVDSFVECFLEGIPYKYFDLFIITKEVPACGHWTICGLHGIFLAICP